MKCRIIAFIFFAGLLIPLKPALLWAGPTVTLESGTERYLLGPHLEFLEDKEKKLAIDDVASPPFASKFSPSREDVPSFGYTDSAYWLRFTVDNQSPVETKWLLEIASPVLDEVAFFVPEGGRFVRKIAGRAVPFGLRDVKQKNLVFYLPVSRSEKQTFYLRAESKSFMAFPSSIWQAEAFTDKDHDEQFLQGIYYGIILVMFLYNLFLFLSLRDKTYLYYILYLITFGFLQLILNGLAHEYFWPGAPEWSRRADSFFSSFTLVWAVLFVRSFLMTRNNLPRTDRLLFALCLFYCLLTFASAFVGQRLIDISGTFFAGIFLVTTVVAGTLCWRKGYRPARFFLIAWGVFITTIMMMVLIVFKLIPHHPQLFYIIQFGSALEVVLLSLALADRISVLQLAKEQAQAEAVRAGQLATLGELAAGVAHEINTPVNGIINCAQLIADEKTATTQTLEVSNRIIREGRRIADIVRRLLTFAHAQRRERREVHLAEVLGDAVSLIHTQLKKEGIIVRMQLGANLPTVRANPQQLEQVFLNLLSNARYALNSRYPGHHENKLLTVSGESAEGGRRVRVIFHDRGSGIPPHLLESITAPFVTTKPPGVGIGLGLSISARIIDEHGGRMAIESVEGEFTVVAVELPREGNG